MNLKQLFTHSGSVDIAEYELGKFIRNKVDSLREHAINNQIKLEIKTEFKYASTWFDQSKVSPIIDKFIRNAIDHAGQKQTIILAISINPQHWQIRITGYKSRRLTQCYTYKKLQLLKRGEELEYSFDKSIFYKKLLRLCNGKILINHSQQSVLLRFPLKYTQPFRFKGKNFLIRASKPVEERFIGNAFMFNEKERSRVLKNPTGKYNHTELTKPFYDKVKNQDDVTKMQYIDINFWLIGDILLKASSKKIRAAQAKTPKKAMFRYSCCCLLLPLSALWFNLFLSMTLDRQLDVAAPHGRLLHVPYLCRCQRRAG